MIMIDEDEDDDDDGNEWGEFYLLFKTTFLLGNWDSS